MIRLGLASLKIEGRLKTPEYVANITRVYRAALDAASKPSNYETVRSQTRYDLEMGFSRGLYPGWFNGINNQELAHARFGKKRGVYLGEVRRIHAERITLQLEAPLKAGDGVVFGRSGWLGQQAIGHTWGADQASDFWSLRVLVVATLAAACSGISNWSHDVGGYLGHRLMEPCPPELLARWLQFGCFTPLMQAHSKMPQEPWRYGDPLLDIYRAYVLLHEQLVPYTRAAAATARRQDAHRDAHQHEAGKRGEARPRPAGRARLTACAHTSHSPAGTAP